MIGIFRQKSPANILILLLFAVLIKLPLFLHLHVPDVQPKDGILFHAILHSLQPAAINFPAIYPFLSFSLIFLQALILNRIMNDQRMMNRPSFLPAMSYIIITSLFAEWNYFSAPLLVNTLLLYVLSSLLKIYNQVNANGSIFNIGLCIGLASLLFFPAIAFTIWALFALMVVRPLRINEWLLCLLGVIAPYYFYAVYLFLSDEWDFQKILPYLTISLPVLKQSIWVACSAILLIIPFLTGGYYMQNILRRLLIQVRQGWSLLLIYILVATFVPFINTSNTFENWVMAAVPFAAFHACAYLYPVKKWFPLILFWLSAGFILLYQYAGPGW